MRYVREVYADRAGCVNILFWNVDIPHMVASYCSANAAKEAVDVIVREMFVGNNIITVPSEDKVMGILEKRQKRIEEAYISEISDLSEANANKLARAGIVTLDDLKNTTEAELREHRGIGDKTIRIIKALAETNGIEFKKTSEGKANDTD